MDHVMDIHTNTNKEDLMYKNRTLVWIFVFLTLEIFAVFGFVSHTGAVVYLKDTFQRETKWMLPLGISLIIILWILNLIARNVLRKRFWLQILWMSIYLFGFCMAFGELNTIINYKTFITATGNVQFIPMIYAFYPCVFSNDFTKSPIPYYTLAICDVLLIILSYVLEPFSAWLTIAILISLLIGAYMIWKTRQILTKIEPHEAFYATILIWSIF